MSLVGNSSSLKRIFVKKLCSILFTTFKYYSIYHVTTNYLIPVDLVICKGNSMEPTLNNNDILLTEKVSVRRQNIRPNDLVICKHPYVTNKTICKRIKETFYDIVNSDENNGKQSDNNYNPNKVVN
jgi:signal peptidase I